VDNGVYELGEPDVSSTLRVAKELHPFEVVCPDAYRDKELTLTMFATHALPLSEHAERVMIVPQGTTTVEWCQCLDEMMDSKTYRELPQKTIGVPKYLDQYEGGRSAALSWIEYHMGEDFMQVHLLGMDMPLESTARVIANFPWVRSVDSTWPYASAEQRELATPMSVKQVVKDWHPGYLPKPQLTLARLNIAIFSKIATMASEEGKAFGHG